MTNEQCMKKLQFIPEQIAFTLRQAETGAPVSEACRKIGVTDQTFERRKQET